MQTVRNWRWRALNRLLVALCVTEVATGARAADPKIPASIYSCETAGCTESSPQYGHWTFAGNRGHASWPKFGIEAELTVERYTAHEVLIRRVDLAAPTGASTIYRGTINGSHIEGTGEYIITGRPNQTFPWNATIHTQVTAEVSPALKPEISAALPDTLHFCAAHCYTFTLKNDHYEGIPGGAYTGTITVRKLGYGS